MREIHWKKLIGAASAAVLAATQVAPTISAFAEEAGTGDYVYCYATMTWAEYWKNEGVYLDSAANGNWEASSDRKSTRLNSSHPSSSRMPSSA